MITTARFWLAYFALVAFAAFGAVNYADAQQGGFPSRPKFQSAQAKQFNVVNPAAPSNSRAVQFTENNSGDFLLYLCEDDLITCDPIISTNGRSGTGASLVRVHEDASLLQALTVYGNATFNSDANVVGNLQENGVDVATVSEGTFTASFVDGCTTTPTVAFRYTKVGSLVSLSANSGFVCVADTNSLRTASGSVPSEIRPGASRGTVEIIGVTVTNNSTTDSVPGCISITTAGLMQILRSTSGACNTGSFTAGGNMGINNAAGADSFSYSIF